jgi:hypothetical protein
MAGALSLTVAVCSLGLGMAVAVPSLAAAPSVAVGTGGTVAGAAVSAAASAKAAADQAAVDRAIDAARAATSGGAGAASLPVTVDRPVPAALQPPLADARADLPAPYGDGCHLDRLETSSPSCLYGNASGSHVVVLFGDSHAAQWWPALQQVALERGWRFVNLTKSACTASDVLQWDGTLKRVYTECPVWRERTLSRIASLHPDLVIVANTFPQVVGSDGAFLSNADALNLYRSGMARTLENLSLSAGRVVMLGEVPHSQYDPPACLSANPSSILACATPVTEAFDPGWEKADQSAANTAGATYIDPTFWVCSSSPCPPVVGNFLVYRDSGHLTPPYVRAIADRLAGSLPGFRNGSGGSQAPAPSPSRSQSRQPLGT